MSKVDFDLQGLNAHDQQFLSIFDNAIFSLDVIVNW